MQFYRISMSVRNGWIDWLQLLSISEFSRVDHALTASWGDKLTC